MMALVGVFVHLTGALSIESEQKGMLYCNSEK